MTHSVIPVSLATLSPIAALSSGMLTFIIVGAIALLAVVIIAGMYNALVRLRNRVKEGWAQIDVQLKRRYDLIPNLVETVKGYAKHEKETLENVIKARNEAHAALAAVGQAMKAGIPAGGGGGGMPGAGANPMAMLAKAEGMLGSAMSGLKITVEQYPDLKANTNFMQMQEELVGTENRIAFARQHYNDEVRLYNTKRETFPTVMLAGMFGFQQASYFEVTEGERENVKVQF